MTGQRPPELFAQERPVRSDFARSTIARERSYARRRVATVLVLISVIASVLYGVWGRGPTRPGEIPTIKSEGVYKQKPADPGGIDIPHQDVRVYDELENKPVPPDQVEHLLPPPEVPQEIPPHAAPVTSFSKQMVIPPTTSAPTVPSTPNVSIAPSGADAEALAFAPSEAKTVTTTVTPSPPSPLSENPESQEPEPIPATTPVHPMVTGPAPLPPKKPSLSIEQVIANTKALAPPPPAASLPPAAEAPPSAAPAPLGGGTPTSVSDKVPLSSSFATPPIPPAGSSVIQLASVEDEAGAESMMAKLQQKYAKELSGVKLHVSRADLGSRGVFYRIQSSGLDEEDANHICLVLKQQNAGCILVRK